jgi:hypothetical protein
MDCSTRQRESEGSKSKDKKIVVIKLKILNKKEKNKNTDEKRIKQNQTNKKISSAKALDLFLWHQIQVLALMTGAFSVSLSLIKFGILGCVVKDAVPLCQTVQGESAGVFQVLFSLV